MKYDVIVVGAGISGATVAERYASQQNKKVLIIDKKNHIGGACYDYLSKEKIIVCKYGPHVFRTNSKEVWDYLNQFSGWIPYNHKVLCYVDGKYLPIPINITTVNELFNINIKNKKEIKAWLSKNTTQIKHPKNLEEIALKLIGKSLYEKIMKNYTRKHWLKDPKELEPSIIKSFPVRTNLSGFYFTERYQGLPKHGYTKMFEKMLSHPNITVKLNTDYFKIKDKLSGFEKLFYTGPVDRFFDYKFGRLEYRSLRIEFEKYDHYYQQNSVINYPNNHKYLRVTEYKYFYNTDSKKTIISKEYPTWNGEPLYPVLTKRNLNICKRYKKEAKKLESKGIYFIGRLATYQYLDMNLGCYNALCAGK